MPTKSSFSFYLTLRASSSEQGDSHVSTNKNDSTIVLSNALATVDKVSSGLLWLSAIGDSAFEQVYVKTWQTTFVPSVKTWIEDFGLGEQTIDLFLHEIEGVPERLQHYEDLGLVVEEGTVRELNEVISAASTPGVGSEIAGATSSIPENLKLGDRGHAGLVDLLSSTSFYYSQIDRLQNPSDPIWRIISDPENGRNGERISSGVTSKLRGIVLSSL